jgi:hypothetical protein
VVGFFRNPIGAAASGYTAQMHRFMPPILPHEIPLLLIFSLAKSRGAVNERGSF